MDADILRLILIALGALLLLGIFLWGHRRGGARAQAVRREAADPRVSGSRVEPRLGDAEDEDEPNDGEDLDRTLHALGGLVEEDRRPVDRPRRPARKAEPKPEKVVGAEETVETRQQDLFVEESTVEGDHYRHANAGLPGLLLQINVAARDGAFEGPDILRAVQGGDLALGEMDIFHRRNGQEDSDAVLFSMASMVNPGTFPPGGMAEFRTPGLTLFAQLPGPRDGMAVFSDMLATAQRLATDLGGELQDETHSRLTKQTIEHLRSQILEHRRRVQLARSKLGR